jgi:hypothetical protein
LDIKNEQCCVVVERTITDEVFANDVSDDGRKTGQNGYESRLSGDVYSQWTPRFSMDENAISVSKSDTAPCRSLLE